MRVNVYKSESEPVWVDFSESVRVCECVSANKWILVRESMCKCESVHKYSMNAHE